MRPWHIPRDFSRFVRNVRSLYELPPEVPPLRQQHMAAGARAFADRYVYMQSLPVGAVCAEVGVSKGDFSAFLLEHAKPRRLHLIDRTLTGKGVPKRLAQHSNVEFHEGQSAEVLATFPDAHFDWIYIDADHDYANVRSEIGVAVAKVKPAGRLIFNDYILWSHREKFYYGVVPAVNELCVNEGWRVEAFCFSSTMNCDVSLRRAATDERAP